MHQSQGHTPSERYLANLAQKNFLSMWSYANVFHSPGKELADLLVICGPDVLVFQDKWSAFPTSSDIATDWSRWCKRTVHSGAKQAWGAERILKKTPAPALYIDPSCQTRVPVPLPATSDTSYHLIVVTHGGSARCHELLGGSGSFMLRSDLRGLERHVEPFCIGDLNPSRTYVHVLDDTTLNVLMATLDTIADFTSYLRKKEALLRSSVTIYAPGEEELLANYLKHVNSDNEHDFALGLDESTRVSGIMLDEGGWNAFASNPQRLAQIEQNRISYLWDKIIEDFNTHALAGTQYTPRGGEFTGKLDEHEKIVRFMARESRFMRRLLAGSIRDMLKTTPTGHRRVRVMTSGRNPGLCYVALLLPIPTDPQLSHDQYRQARATFLEGTCMTARLMNPDIREIIGIATETGLDNGGRSSDAMYLDVRDWTPAMESSARDFQEKFDVLLRAQAMPVQGKEYPDVVSREEFLKNPVNKPCPCGSGRKYKKCCRPKGRTFYQ